MTKKNLSFSDVNIARLVFGERDKNLTEIEKFFEVEIIPIGTDLLIQLDTGRRQADTLVSLGRIPEARRVEWSDDGGLTYGGSVPIYNLTACGGLSCASQGEGSF